MHIGRINGTVAREARHDMAAADAAEDADSSGLHQGLIARPFRAVT